MIKDLIWMMERKHVEAMFSEIRSMSEVFAGGVDVHAARMSASDAPWDQVLSYEVSNGVARIRLAGPIMKSVPWILKFFGLEATSTEEARAALTRALADDDASSVFLDIDSPGGTASGIQALGDDIFAARSIKPVHAHAPDIAASAAYWLGSQATRFTAGMSAQLGSIGAYTVIRDFSKALDEAGIKTHVISSGPHKGIGVMGAPVDDAAIKLIQGEIDELAALFIDAVARGRGMERDQVKALATGRTWFATEAKRLGLIDAVETDRRAMATTAKATTKAAAESETQLIDRGGEDDPPTPQPALVEGAQKEQTMTAKNLEAELAERVHALETELGQVQKAAQVASARAEAAEAALAEVHKTQRTAIIDDAMRLGKVVPATRPATEKLGEAFGDDLDGFRETLAAYPVITRPETDGETPKEDEAALSGEEQRVASMFSLTAEEWKEANG